MLISKQDQGRPELKKVLLLAALSLLSAYFIYLFSSSNSTQQSTASTPQYPLIWDAEQRDDSFFLSTNGAKVKGGETQSSEFAHSGTYSSKLTEGQGAQYGITYVLTNIRAGQLYKASVWRKKSKHDIGSYLVVGGEKGSGLYLSTERISQRDPGGWNKIDLLFLVPKDYKGESINIYVFSDGRGNVFWDDFRIDQIKNGETVDGFVARRINLKVKDKAYRKLKSKRQKALERGILRTEEDSWVKGILQDSSEEMSIKLRLKGDWLDHLSPLKWSLRIKVKDPNAWNRIKEFSLHTPQARYFVHEWLLHQFWEREDVLTTRYDFLQLYLNDRALGTYAYEEHFDKQLLEFRHRREGPILKFSEDALWDARLRQNQNGGLDNLNKPIIAEMVNAEVAPFKEQRTLGNPALHKSFEIARELLTDYQQGRRPADEIFDLERTARYYAIADILGAHHGLIWHNQRFYFNPITARLEPIGYDGFSNQPRKEALLLGKELIENGLFADVDAMKRLFENEQFIALYMEQLFRLSREEYLQSFLDEVWLGVEARVDFLKTEFSKLKVDKLRILKRAAQIRSKLLPYHKHSVKAYWKGSGEGQRKLELSSTHELPLKIVGFGTKANRLSQPLEESIMMAPYYMGRSKSYRELELPDDYRYVFYSPFGIDTLFSSPISNWPRARFADQIGKHLPADKIQCALPYQQTDQIIQIEKGRYKVKEKIHFPAGLEIYVPAGTEINFVNGAGWISRSPVFLNGSFEEPIVFRSEDQSATGFTVLQAEETSRISYCNFNGFNTFKMGGLTLTGAVSFYESPLHINHCVIQNNQCEDALNLIRSDFEIDQLTIQNAPFDGFDADFCKGTISHSRVRAAGNDGYDFSGSEIKVYKCDFRQCGDKGISVGEESRVELEAVAIDSATIGVVSKDLSYVRVRSVDLQHCNQGFAAYQKKPEFGHSSIVVDDYRAKEVRILHTIATRCTLELKNHVIIGE